MTHHCSRMTESYFPPSDFLQAIIAEEVPLTGNGLADSNLQLLIAMTSDDDVANRDWATMLLSQTDLDTPQIREALLRSACDPNEDVRGEAILGLAQRDKMLAIPLVQAALSKDSAQMTIFEAAEIIASPVLVEYLLPFATPSGRDMIDDWVLRAISACKDDS